MNIAVCISQTPDTTAKIVIAQEGKTIDSKGVKFILNPYDEFAVEEALRRKEATSGTVTIVCVGDDSAKETIRVALAMGADKGILIKDIVKSDSYSIAENLADTLKVLGADIIFMGRQSIDFDSAQMGPTVAAMMSIPFVSFVTKLEINGKSIIAERDIEGGKEVVETSLPCIITTQKGLNEPRYPKLPDIMKAKSKPIDEKNSISETIRVVTKSMSNPAAKQGGKILDYSPENVKELVRLLHEEAKVI
jgi:electron transfer flavoprotein beta subunit